MNTILTNPKKAAILGACLCLPIAIIIALLWFNIEPPVGLLRGAPNDRADVLGSLFVLGLAWLLPGALVIVLAPVMRGVHAGSKMTAYPVNLLRAAVIMFFIS